jgi:NitT/TauT family transport system substrate-binding protein
MVTVFLLRGRQSGFRQETPVATKRAVRALLKANNARPNRETARFLVDPDSPPTTTTRAAIHPRASYARWRDFSTEDSTIFRAALTRSGYIKASPKTILAKGTDWRFLNELKKELKTAADAEPR